MNEASSKYVDRFAVAKLIETKLDKSVLRPGNGDLETVADIREDFRTLLAFPVAWHATRQNGGGTICFQSAVPTGHPENDTVKIWRHAVDHPKGCLVFVHGLYDDNPVLYQPWIRSLNDNGLDVYSFILPYHFDRQPRESLYSGEYFLSSRLATTCLAVKQAVFDLYQFYNQLKRDRTHPVTIVAFSMGGGIALNLYSLFPEMDDLILINPLCSFTDIIWDTPLCLPIKDRLEDAGVGFKDIRRIFAPLDPVALAGTCIKSSRILAICSRYDQITKPEHYATLTNAWAFDKALEYNAGHLNVFRVPRLTGDICQFYFEN